MIPIVEDYLSELIQNKLGYIKSNPNHIDKILRTSPDRLNKLKTFIHDNRIRIIKGYPRTPAELPCICILLSNEDEMQEGLGDYGDSVDSDIRESTQEVMVVDSIGSGYDFPHIKVPTPSMVEISSIVHNDTGIELDPHEYSIENHDLGLVGIYGGIAEHGDSLTISYTYRFSAMEQTRVLYESNYRLECWANNGDLVVELYHILKWILISGRDHLVADKDLFRQKLSGADFEPAPNFFPEFVYRRALSFWCQFNVSAPEDDEVRYIEQVITTQKEYPSDFGSGGD